MHQTDKILDMAEAQGLNISDSNNQADRLRSVAEQVGIKDYNSLYDNNRLESALKEQQASSGHGGNLHSNPNPADAQKLRAKNNLEEGAKAAGATALQAKGVPRPLAKAAVNQLAKKPAIQGALGAASRNPFAKRVLGSPMMAGLGKMGAGGAGATDNKSDAEKTAKEKDAEESTKEASSGIIKVGFSRVAMIKIALGVSSIGLIVVFFVTILSLIANDKAAFIIMGDMSAADKDLITEIVKEIPDLLTGQGTGNLDYNDPLFEYYKRFEILGNVFSSKFRCDEKECTVDREEFRYYLKVADISLRYRNKYGINLDWVLLNATILYNDKTEEEIMGAQLHDYNLEDVEKYSILMDLDWDYDYKKISGYTYLNAKDSRYDLQILAKNMVTKTTVQTCTKEIKDSQGNVIRVEIVKEQTDIDVEEQYFEPGQPYRLECPAGTTYDRNSTYVLDPDKYYEFLLEYLEKKFYLAGHVIDADYDGFEPSPEVGSGDYIFPLPKPRCMSSPYGFRAWDQMWHRGVDWPAPEGTPIYAIADGVVVASGSNPSRWPEGIFVKISHGNGIESLYLHGSSINVKNGDEIKQGQVIMTVGTTGYSSGNHLHFEFRINGRGVEPSPYIGSVKAC